MKVFQATADAKLTSGIAVRRDERHRPYVLVGANVQSPSEAYGENPANDHGTRVYLTGALWQDVCNKCGPGDEEMIHEADLIAGPDGTFLLGPCKGDSDDILVNCDFTTSKQIEGGVNVQILAALVTVNAGTAFASA